MVRNKEKIQTLLPFPPSSPLPPISSKSFPAYLTYFLCSIQHLRNKSCFLPLHFPHFFPLFSSMGPLWAVLIQNKFASAQAAVSPHQLATVCCPPYAEDWLSALQRCLPWATGNLLCPLEHLLYLLWQRVLQYACLAFGLRHQLKGGMSGMGPSLRQHLTM